MYGRSIDVSRLYSIDDKIIGTIKPDLLCDDSDNGVDNSILVSPDFTPDTFFMSDRLSQRNDFLAPEERDGEKWITRIVNYELLQLEKEGILERKLRYSVAKHCVQQAHNLLEYMVDNRTVASTLTNQEVPDVIRKVLSYVLFGYPILELPTHRMFNEFAWKTIPSLIKQHFSSKTYSLKGLLLFGIASGLIGLDLKGSSAAASNIASIRIPLKPLWTKQDQYIADSLWAKLSQCVANGLLVDYWNEFEEEVLNNKCNLLWFLDDYIESFFDLFFIQEMLACNQHLRIVVVPKKIKCGNDMTYADVQQALGLVIFKRLNEYISDDRVKISTNGPTMGTVNLRKLSKEVVADIKQSDCVFIKGCRAHELIQGGLNKTTYTAYVVAREFSESETGFDSRLSPLLLFRNRPGEYTYWGFKGRAKRQKVFEDGRTISICYSTLEEHEKRNRIIDPNKSIVELEKLLAIQKDVLDGGYSAPYRLEAQPFVDRLVNQTQANYDSIAHEYKNIRRERPHSVDIRLFQKLLTLAHNLVKDGMIGDSNGNISLLDIGTGSGRDLRYFMQFRDIKAMGIDNSKAFVKILDDLAEKGEIHPNSYLQMDMRNLRFSDDVFDIVRHNATLLHLPVIMRGIGVDAALEESFRVLKSSGLLFVNVKAGIGMDFVDTGEGLGGRFFQFFTNDSLRTVLERNRFKVLEIEKWHEDRPSGRIEWLAAYAQKET